MSRTGFAALMLGASLLGGSAMAETMVFHAKLDGATEVPPKTTAGAGQATVTLDTTAKTVTYAVTYTGLSGPATMGHIHGPAAPGANAGIVVPFANAASPIDGKATLTDAQIADLEAGKYYVNVHTAANPAGEIRGQLVK